MTRVGKTRWVHGYGYRGYRYRLPFWYLPLNPYPYPSASVGFDYKSYVGERWSLQMLLSGNAGDKTIDIYIHKKIPSSLHHPLSTLPIHFLTVLSMPRNEIDPSLITDEPHK